MTEAASARGPGAALWRCRCPMGCARPSARGLGAARRDGALDADWRWADPAGWHITLAFLGATPPDDGAVILQRLAAGPDRHRRVSPSAPAASALSPAGRRARVLWYGIRDADRRLADLASLVRRATGTDEDAPFRPHVTLARARDRHGTSLPSLRVDRLPAAEVPVASVDPRAQPPGRWPRPLRNAGRVPAARPRSGRNARMSEPIAPLRPPHVAVIGEGDPRGPDAHRLLEWAEEVGVTCWPGPAYDGRDRRARRRHAAPPLAARPRPAA